MTPKKLVKMIQHDSKFAQRVREVQLPPTARVPR
eukprot:COSAG01_NODE_34388_length_548_cov_1.427617_1_plen_33_part_10